MSRQIPPCPLMLAHLCCMQLLAIGVQPAFMRLGCSLAVIASLLLGGCTGLPANTDRVTSHASNDTGSTRLAIIAQASLPGVDRLQSGLRLLPDGRQALEARLSLAAAAESSIDAQYYQIETDRSGLCFLASLRAAALRGVRVRLLVDDLHASGQDELLSGLARAGMEVRMFNPLPVRTGSTGSRILWSLHEFSRINRRMHNKLFIVDGAFAISGGRSRLLRHCRP